MIVEKIKTIESDGNVGTVGKNGTIPISQQISIF